MMSTTKWVSFAVALVAIIGAATETGAADLHKDQAGILAWALSDLKPAVVVSKRPGDGGDVTTINEAVRRSDGHQGGGTFFVIYIKAGVYEEHVTVKADNVVLIGDGVDKTVLTGNLSNGTGHATNESATLTAAGAGFMARDVTIRNSAGGDNDRQAVAFYSMSDRSVLYRCSIQGYQDTLYADAGRQFYRDCSISGRVDFIFGKNAAAVFQNCQILVRRPAMPGQQVVITAQGREEDNSTGGFVFQGSSVAAGDPDLNGAQTFLRRPWKRHARVVFMMCTIDSIVHADGWVAWNKSGQGAPPAGHMYYGEFRNHGSGADATKRVRWDGFHDMQTDEEARPFTPRWFIDGLSWLPGTGVPYYLDLQP